MKMLPLALVAALAASAVALPATAEARGWHNRHHHQHCWTEWRHHHRVRVCR